MDAWHRTSVPSHIPEQGSLPDEPGRGRRAAGQVAAVLGMCLVLLMLAVVAFQAVLVLLLVRDTPDDPYSGGIQTCTTLDCIAEARTVFPALIVVVVAVAVGILALRRPSWATIAACAAAALVLLVLDVDPDVEGYLRPAALGMAIVAAGTWLRLRVPVPPSMQARASPVAHDLLRRSRTEIAATWRDAGLPAPRPRPPAPPSDAPSAPPSVGPDGTA